MTPYAFIDAIGHKHLVLNETFTVVTDIGHGEHAFYADTQSYELALAWRDCLRADGMTADIEIERSSIDLTEAVDDHLAHWVSPLVDLAVEWRDGRPA